MLELIPEVTREFEASRSSSVGKRNIVVVSIGATESTIVFIAVPFTHLRSF